VFSRSPLFKFLLPSIFLFIKLIYFYFFHMFKKKLLLQYYYFLYFTVLLLLSSIIIIKLHKLCTFKNRYYIIRGPLHFKPFPYYVRLD
jgi:hypothetical protein